LSPPLIGSLKTVADGDHHMARAERIFNRSLLPAQRRQPVFETANHDFSGGKNRSTGRRGMNFPSSVEALRNSKSIKMSINGDNQAGFINWRNLSQPASRIENQQDFGQAG
jgi:hypothetical protein